MPRSQRTHRTTRIVQSIAVPISQENCVYSACGALGSRFRLPRRLIVGALKQDICSLAHTFECFWIALFLGCSLHFAGVHDETLRRGTYIMEWKAGEQGEVVSGGRFQNANVRRSNDFDRVNDVVKAPLLRLESDLVANANIAERTEKRVAVSC